MADILTDEEIFFKDWEPKLENRFFMYVDDIPSYIIKAAQRPKMTNGQVVLDHINVDRKLKAKSRWNDITLTLYDPIIPSGAQAVINWIRKHHESTTGRDGYATEYKKDLKLHAIGPPGDKVEEWIIKGAYILDADWGNQDWSAESHVEINLTISYNYAELNY